MSRSRTQVRAAWLGSVPYAEAWDLQKLLVEEVRAGGPEALLLLEHPHVFTMGTRGSADNVLWDAAERRRRNIEIIWADRGGDVTYHGPGQLTGYPILDLARHGGDLLVYLRNLEAALVSYMAELGVEAASVPGLTGVWHGSEKVAAIGIKKSGSIVSHGFALNLTTDLDYFAGIVPCGLDDKTATSMERLTGRRVSVEAAARGFAPHFERALDVDLEWLESLHLPEPAGAADGPRTP